MVATRVEVLQAGRFDPLLARLVEVAHEVLDRPRAPDGLVVDVGAGPGLHLARVLDALPDRHGLAVDVSKPAARRAAQAHPRAGAVVADVWGGLPLGDGTAALLLDVFAPRDAATFARVLAPEGRVVVVTPRPEHLAAVLGPLSLVAVDPTKDARLTATFAGRFTVEDRATVGWELDLDRAAAVALVAMGPGGHHHDRAELERRAAALPERLVARAAVDVTILGHRDRP
jgi:23S rRNA (guanine745-N1)-methyltransferase